MTDQAIAFHAELGIALRRLYAFDMPEITMPMVMAVELAPADLKEAIFKKLRLIGVIPDPDGYLEDGTPAYRLESIAKRLAIPLEEARGMLNRINDERNAMGLKPIRTPDLIHQTH